MIFGKHSKALAHAKSEFLYEIAHSGVELMKNPKVLSSQVSTYGSIVDKMDKLGLMKEAIRSGNGHITKVEILKPVNNQNFPDHTHTVEISFQGMEGSNALSHSTAENDHVRLIGSVQKVAEIFSEVEKISVNARQRVIDFTLTWLGQTGVLDLPINAYKVTYDRVAGLSITDGKVVHLIEGPIHTHFDGSHATDIYIFDPKLYSLDTKSAQN